MRRFLFINLEGGIIILKTAIEIFEDAVYTLIDGFDAKKTTSIIDLISDVNGVIRVLDLKGRAHGNMSFIDVTIAIHPSLSIREAHQINLTIRETIQTFEPYSTVLIQVVPND